MLLYGLAGDAGRLRSQGVSIYQNQQQRYHQTLGEADQSADCSGFIVFMLTALQSALQQAVLGNSAQESAQENTQDHPTH